MSRFLKHKDKVKITIMFRGREVTHPERGTALLDRLAEELSEIGVVEQSPVQDGRNMTMLLAPSKAVLAGEKDKAADGKHDMESDGDEPDGRRAAAERARRPPSRSRASRRAAESQPSEPTAAEPQPNEPTAAEPPPNGAAGTERAPEPVQAESSTAA